MLFLGCKLLPPGIEILGLRQNLVSGELLDLEVIDFGLESGIFVPQLLHPFFEGTVGPLETIDADAVCQIELVARIVELSGRSFEIIVNTLEFQNGKPWLVKLRPIDHNCFHNVPGGIDITTVFDVNGTILNGWDMRTLGVDSRHMNDVDSPPVWFGGVQTRALTPERGRPYLLSKYGDQWAVKQHPSIKLPPPPRAALASVHDTIAR